MCWQISYELIPPLCPFATVMTQPLKEGAQMYVYKQTRSGVVHTFLLQTCKCAPSSGGHPEVLQHISDVAC